MSEQTTKESVEQVFDERVDHTPLGNEMLSMLKKFDQIEEKNKCLRVRFLDWASDKLLAWSNRLHEMSARIDSPCVIKVEPRKKEDGISKDQAEILRLRELLKEAKTREDNFRNMMNEKYKDKV